MFLDLSKAFDTINHQKLLRKLEYYGIRGHALEWFRSYFDNRLQFVELTGTRSSLKQVHYGIPHGSVLGPHIQNHHIHHIQNVY